MILDDPARGGECRLTLDEVLCLILAIACINDTLHDMEVELALALCFPCDHVLLELLRIVRPPAVVVYVVLDRALEVVVEFADALVGGCRLVVLPRRVVVRLVLPFDLVPS